MIFTIFFTSQVVSERSTGSPQKVQALFSHHHGSGFSRPWKARFVSKMATSLFSFPKKKEKTIHETLGRRFTFFGSPKQTSGILLAPNNNPQQKRTSWWFQSIWKLCSSNWIISPGLGVNIKIFELPPPSVAAPPQKRGSFKLARC